MTEDFTKLEIAILRRMKTNKVWGKHHWREDTMKKGFPPHLRKLVMKSAKSLKRKGYLLMKPTPHGKQWYLNRNKVKKILELTDL